MSAIKSFSNLVLIIKRYNVGETDRIITLISQEKGKFVAIAKGVRKLHSSRGAFLEPGNLAQAFFVNTKSLPILTQARLIANTETIRGNLNKFRQLSQILEIFDRLLVEEELTKETFNLIVNIRQLVLQTNKNSVIKTKLGLLVENLGFGNPQDKNVASILDYVSQLSEKPMKSFEYLKVK